MDLAGISGETEQLRGGQNADVTLSNTQISQDALDLPLLGLDLVSETRPARKESKDLLSTFLKVIAV